MLMLNGILSLPNDSLLLLIFRCFLRRTTRQEHPLRLPPLPPLLPLKRPDFQAPVPPVGYLCVGKFQIIPTLPNGRCTAYRSVAPSASLFHLLISINYY